MNAASAANAANAGITFDTGALIGIEHGSRRMQALLERVAARHMTIAVPAGVVGRVWRGGSRQARLARFLVLDHVTVVPLDAMRARAAGIVCARTGTSDVIDASVVLCAREHGHRAIVTSDPEDLAILDSGLDLVSL